MKTHRTLRLAIVSLAMSTIIFLSAIFSLAKPMHAMYTELFQSKQAYQGETRAVFYNHFLITIIAPTSLMLGILLTAITNKYLNKKSNPRNKKIAHPRTEAAMTWLKLLLQRMKPQGRAEQVRHSVSGDWLQFIEPH